MLTKNLYAEYTENPLNATLRKQKTESENGQKLTS